MAQEKILSSLDEIVDLFKQERKDRKLSPSQLFIKQAQILNQHESTEYFDHNRTFRTDIYTYKELTNQQLKSYISWRCDYKNSKQRYHRTYKSFINIYTAELVNLIDCKDIKHAYEELLALRSKYDCVYYYSSYSEIIKMIDKAIRDFIVFYDMDLGLFKDRLTIEETLLFVFLDIPNKSDEQIWDIVYEKLESSWTVREFSELSKPLIIKVIRAIDHFAKQKHKKNMAELLFNAVEEKNPYNFFEPLPFEGTLTKTKINVLPTLKYKKLKDGWFKYQIKSDIIKLLPKIFAEIDNIIKNEIYVTNSLPPQLLTADIVEVIKETCQQFFKETLKLKKKDKDQNNLQTYLAYKNLIEHPVSYNFKNSIEAVDKAKALENRFKNILYDNSDRDALFLLISKVLENVQESSPVKCKAPEFWGFRAPEWTDLTKDQIRAYIYWRTCWRKGLYKRTYECYQIIYISELINLVGCDSPQDALEKLKLFKKKYTFANSQKALVTTIITDFSRYYDLNFDYSNVKTNIPCQDTLNTLSDLHNKSIDEVFNALLEVDEKTILSSKLYKAQPDTFKALLVRSLRQIDLYLTNNNNYNSWIEFCFGSFKEHNYTPFHGVVFVHTKPKKKIFITPLLVCKFESDKWKSYSFNPNVIYGQKTKSKLSWYEANGKRFSDNEEDALYSTNLKHVILTIDSYIREEINFKFKTKSKLEHEWIKEAVKKAFEVLHSEERQARLASINFDVSLLDGIRSKAEQTKEKLLTEEEKLDIQEKPLIKIVNTNIEKSESEAGAVTEGIDSLSKEEKRFLNCLLKNTPTNWIVKEGLTSPILCDSINEKLYTMFEDNIIENGALIEDYIDDLKESLSA